jgi:hypothetical protein
LRNLRIATAFLLGLSIGIYYETVGASSVPVFGPYRSVILRTAPIDRRGTFYTTGDVLVEMADGYYLIIDGKEE